MSKSGSSSTELSESSTESAIESDTDIIDYFRENPSKPIVGSPVLSRYASERDFLVEPLETQTAVFLLNRKYDDLTAEVVDGNTFKFRVPNGNNSIRSVTSTVQKWGYEVMGARDVNTSRMFVEAIVKQSPNESRRLQAFLAMDYDIPLEVILDSMLFFDKGETNARDNGVSLQTWSMYRSVDPEKIKENVKKMSVLIEKCGGLPGTQSSIQEDGGVPIPQANTR